jgi:hypothetical protein
MPTGATVAALTIWAETAEEIRTGILAHGVSDRGVLRHHYDTDALDASTLLARCSASSPEATSG